MSYWIFLTHAACEAANVADTNRLPEDAREDGAPVAEQITERWAEPIALSDGR